MTLARAGRTGTAGFALRRDASRAGVAVVVVSATAFFVHARRGGTRATGFALRDGALPAITAVGVDRARLGRRVASTRRTRAAGFALREQTASALAVLVASAASRCINARTGARSPRFTLREETRLAGAAVRVDRASMGVARDVLTVDAGRSVVRAASLKGQSNDGAHCKNSANSHQPHSFILRGPGPMYATSLRRRYAEYEVREGVKVG